MIFFFPKSGHITSMSKELIQLTEDGLITKIILREGNGVQPKDKDRVKVHYIGKLQSNNNEFDNSRTKDQPFVFTIGTGVIEGWNISLKTMKVGELSTFIIDSKYAYGESGKEPQIPPNATLISRLSSLRS